MTLRTGNRSFSSFLPQVILLFTAISPLLAQSPNYDGRPVTAVTYAPEKQPLDNRDLEALQLVKTGAPLRSSAIAQTIDKLYATGAYEDIQVEAQPSGTGVAIRFVTKANWFIGHIEITGKVSDPPNRGQLLSTAQFPLGAKFQPEMLKTAQDSLKKLFTANGLYDAGVDISTEEDPDTQQVSVTVDVKAGKRAKYEEPELHGDLKLPEKTILRATGWKYRFIKRWRQVTNSRTQKGVEGILKKYQSKDRLAATVDLKSLDYDAESRRVKPRLEIAAGPKIEIKAVEAKVSKSRLKRYVPVYEEGAVDRDLLVEGARNLRDYFQSQGYPEVDVTFQELPLKDDTQTIQFFIARGPKRKLSHIEIAGNKYFTVDLIRERMFLQPSSLQFRNGRFSEAFRKKDEETIEALYKSNGFRDVKAVSTITNNYKGKENQLSVTFTVTEGPQWRIASIDTSGVKGVDLSDILLRLSSAEGQPFSDLNISEDRNVILTYYYENGFPKANFKWTATPSGTPTQVDLHYVLEEGSQEFVRRVVVSGLHTSKQKFVDKHLKIQPDAPLSPVEIANTQRGLYDLGVFAKINTAVQDFDGDIDRKFVLFDFEEAARYTVNVGVGAEIARLGGTSTEIATPVGNTGFGPRVSLDVSRLNFLGIGHSVTLHGRISSLQQKASISYLAPRLGDVEGRDLTFSAIYDLSRDVRTFASKRQEASVQLSNKLSRATTLFARFAYRRVSTTDIVIPALLVPQLLQAVRIGITSVNLVQDRRDNPTDAKRGVYNTVDLALASKVFGSQRNFGRLLARNATYTKIGKKFVLARQTTFGLIQPFSNAAGLTAADEIPLPERFFGGGSITHRGFPENQAGPRDVGTPAGPGGTATQATGFPLGGNALFFNNIELRFPLIGENIAGVVFHDAGNVFTTLGDISFRVRQRDLQDFNYMVHAAGFGVRYKTPIGPVRLDLAYSINPPSFNGFKGTIQDLLACGPGSSANPACQVVKQNSGHIQFFFSIGQTF